MAKRRITKEDVEVKDAVVKTFETKEVKPVVQKRKLNRDDSIPVMNYTTGRLIHDSRITGQTWIWDNFGDIYELELQELISIKNSAGRMLSEVWMLILDDDAVEHLGLTKYYDNVLDPNDFDIFFDLADSKIDEILSKAPSSVKEIICHLAKKKIEGGELNRFSTIKLLEKHFEIELVE